jgi:hypothetical protein
MNNQEIINRSDEISTIYNYPSVKEIMTHKTVDHWVAEKYIQPRVIKNILEFLTEVAVFIVFLFAAQYLAATIFAGFVIQRLLSAAKNVEVQTFLGKASLNVTSAYLRGYAEAQKSYENN